MFDFSVIFDIGVVGLRILMPLYAIFIVYQCYAAMRRRRRPEKPLVTLMNTATMEKIPVVPGRFLGKHDRQKALQRYCR